MIIIIDLNTYIYIIINNLIDNVYMSFIYIYIYIYIYKYVFIYFNFNNN